MMRSYCECIFISKIVSIFDIQTYILWCIDTKRYINKQVFVSSFNFCSLTWPIQMTWISRYIFIWRIWIVVFSITNFFFLSKFVQIIMPNIDSMHAKIETKIEHKQTLSNFRWTTGAQLRKRLFRFIIIMAFFR